MGRILKVVSVLSEFLNYGYRDRINLPILVHRLTLVSPDRKPEGSSCSL